MAISPRSSGFSGTTRTAPGGAVEAVETAAFTRQSFLGETAIPCRNAEPVQEIVVVPVREVIAQFPAEALAKESCGQQSLVQVIPVMRAREAVGPICFSVAAIQQACPHLFRSGYRVDPEAVIQIPEDQVFLGYPRRLQSSSTP